MAQEIKFDEQGKVVGGFQQDTSCIKEGHVGIHIAATDASNYLFKMVYVIADNNPNAYCYGVLYMSSEHSNACDSEIIHGVNVKYVNPGGGLTNDSGYNVREGECTFFNADDVTLYLKEA